MRTVVRHAIYAQHRKDRCLVPLDPAWDQPAPEAGSEAEICAVIRSMPAEYRVALELKFVLEWKEEKIAEQLGLSLGATYTRISRGRRLLQERLISGGVCRWIPTQRTETIRPGTKTQKQNIFAVFCCKRKRKNSGRSDRKRRLHRPTAEPTAAGKNGSCAYALGRNGACPEVPSLCLCGRRPAFFWSFFVPCFLRSG